MKKHVFVETNFIIELVRPVVVVQDAVQLFERRNTDVNLYLPWVSIVESKRTLDRIIREDLGFESAMLRFGIRQLQTKDITNDDKKVLDKLAVQASQARANALKTISTTINNVVTQMRVIEPTKEVVQKTLEMYPIKSLPPFDEMVLGAVLTKAQELFKSGETELFFCNLNKKDFDSAGRPNLAAEYAASGIQYVPGFNVPA